MSHLGPTVFLLQVKQCLERTVSVLGLVAGLKVTVSFVFLIRLSILSLPFLRPAVLLPMCILEAL